MFQTRSDTTLGRSGSVSVQGWGHFRTNPRRSWCAWDAPRSFLRCSFGISDLARACPGASPKRLRAPKTAQDRFCIDFVPILGPFSAIFERFFIDFRSSRLRRRHKIGISKRSRVILTARLGSCIAQALRTARASFEMTCERYMFSLFSLRTHKPT